MRVVVVFFCALGFGGSIVLAQSIPAAAPSPAAKSAVTPPARKGQPIDGIAECMRLWDAATHMTRQEWARTCRRIQSRLENLKVENLKFDEAKIGRKRARGE